MEIEKGQIIRFNDENWHVEDIKYFEDGQSVIIFSKTDVASDCMNPIEMSNLIQYTSQAIDERWPLPWQLKKEPKGKYDFSTLDIIDSQGEVILCSPCWVNEDFIKYENLLRFIVDRVNGYTILPD